MQTNHLIQKDNIDALRELPDASIDLVYADPPFNTGHDFNADQGGYIDKYNDADALDLPDWMFEITTRTQQIYFDAMLPVIKEIHRILKKTGAVYWHVDDKTSSWYRLIFNQIFGQASYRNEIIWTYTPSMLVFKGKVRKHRSNTDHILFYAGEDHKINPQYHPLTAQEIKRDYPYTDSKGRKYRNESNKSSLGGLPGKDKRLYADENKGKLIGSCWTDIPIATTKERTGYPTQKPIKLISRIIEASSQEGDIVLDPYVGSGTTCVAAQRLNRRWIGIDENEESIHISRRRLNA